MISQNDYASVFLQRFSVTRNQAISIYLAIRDNWRALRSWEIVQLFPEVPKYDVHSIISMLSRYPENNPLIRKIGPSQICSKYMADRFPNAGREQYLLSFSIPKLVGRKMMIGQKNERYKCANDERLMNTQLINTALYFIFTNHLALSQMVQSEIKLDPKVLNFFAPLIKDLDYIQQNPPKPIERKSSNI